MFLLLIPAVLLLVIRVYVFVGVSWGSTVCSQHHLHASHWWLVGSHQWDGQEQLPHTVAGCALIHTAPHPRHSRDRLPAAPWWGDQSVLRFFPQHTPKYTSLHNMLETWRCVACCGEEYYYFATGEVYFFFCFFFTHWRSCMEIHAWVCAAHIVLGVKSGKITTNKIKVFTFIIF